MPQRYFNWKLAVVLVIGITMLGITFVGLREWRKANSAGRGLTEGDQAYEEQNWEKAAGGYGRYLSVNQNDAEVLMKYADAQLKIRPTRAGQIQQAIQAYRNILRIEPANTKASEQLTELYFLIGEYDNAEMIISRQLETHPDPELSRLYAVALVQQRKFKDAADVLKELCTENPNMVLAYETAGQLAEQQPEEFSQPASFWYDEVVKNNPSSALAYIIRAGYYRRVKNIDLALTDLEKAEQLDLSKYEIGLRLAMEYIYLNLWEEAEVVLNKVREIAPDNQRLWQMLAQVALMSQSKEKMTETVQSGLKELSAQPWDFIPLAIELFIQAGEYDKADSYISQLKDKNFEPSNITYLEGLLAAEKGDYLDAIKSWEYSIKSGNNSTKVILKLASVLLKSGDTSSAINKLRMLVSERPDTFEVQLALARVLAQNGNWLEVLEYASKAIELEPGNQEALSLLLQAQIQTTSPSSDGMESLQRIDENLSKLIAEGADSIEIGMLQYQIEMRKGNYSKANEVINQLKQKSPTQVNIYLAEAELFAIQNKIDEAINILKETIEKFPDVQAPVRYLAVLFNEQDNKDACIDVITKALDRMTDPLIQRDLSFLLAAFYERWNQNDKSYELLNVIAKEFPNDITIKRRLLLYKQVIEQPNEAQKIIDNIKTLEGDDGWQWRYEQAKIWYLSDDFDGYYSQIVTLLQENILSNSGDQSSRLLLANAYQKAGDFQLAITLYRDALSRSPENVQILSNLITALYNIKEYDQAEELLKQVPEQSQNSPQLQKLQLQNYLRQGEIESASDILQNFVGNDPNNQQANLALALLSMQQGKYADAEKLLSQLKINDPCSISITASQIQLNIMLDKPQEAMRICDEYVDNIKNSSAYILRARAYASLNQLEKSFADINKAIELEPENTQVWLARSDFFLSTGDKEKALEDIKKALSLDSDNVQIQKRAIMILLTSNSPDMISEGKTIIEQALNNNPDDIELRLYKANILYNEGTESAIENARQILQKITQEEPAFIKAWLLLGEIMINKGQPGTAMDYASRGLAYQPGDEKLLLLKARAEAVRSPVLAVPTLKVLCEMNPDNTEAVSYLANIYVNTNEPAKAVSLLENILTKCDVSNIRTYNITLAAAMYKTGSKNEALNKLDALIAEAPEDQAALLAQIYLLRDDKLWDDLQDKALDWYQNNLQGGRSLVVIAGNLIGNQSGQAKNVAEEILRTVIKNEPENIDALYSLALLMGMTERSEEAVILYRKLLDIAPENVIAINNLAWILCEDQDSPQEALEMAQEGLKLSPNYIDLIDTRGMIYYRLGQFQKSVDDFTTCVKLYPDTSPQSIASRFHLAKAYAGLKENAQALKYLRDVLNSKEQIGGLTAKDIAEAQSMLKQLQKEI